MARKETRYYWNGEIWVPSVTSVMPPPYLAQWAANCAVDYLKCLRDGFVKQDGRGWVHQDHEFEAARTAFERESKQAADYGTYIHTLCAYSLKHDICVESPDEITNGFMKQWYEWCKKHKVKAMAMEHEVLMPYYGGRVDLVCEMDGKVTIIDWKTGKGSYYDSWKWQLAGYRQAWNSHAEETWQNQNTGKWETFNKGVRPIQSSIIVKFNKKTGKMTHKCFDEYQATRTNPKTKEKEKYTRTYEMDRWTFNSLVAAWWLINRGMEI
ncbi:hypothetical protein LCGC14_1530500 [marine sediment metagenome]|uniref:PD-(D/E)XK endonuclease-like domain-containing protein n=1 Tax=marine sediment metagenome TaxID=412755 RepID=A0A0F9IWB6_9ZZZZ